MKDILPETITSYDADDSESFKTIAVFDCRGYVPVDFDFTVYLLDTLNYT